MSGNAPDVWVVDDDRSVRFVLATALSEAGYRVPADVRVVGFDDSEASRQTTPPLTTMTGRAHEMARIAGRMLRNSLAGRPFTYPVILNSELVPRASA